MLPQTNALPFNDVDGVKFNVLIKTNIVLKNGKKSVMLTAVPEDISLDDVMAGIGVGAKLSERVAVIQHDIFTLINGRAESFGFSHPRFFEEK